jgi:hypothetical protein
MMSHVRLAACKAPNSCDPLKGNTFKINLSDNVQGIDGATVTIADDLSYTIRTPGHPDQNGQLTPDGPNRYRYSEPGPPPITGRLNCIMGVWYFNDKTTGGEGEAGSLELQNS